MSSEMMRTMLGGRAAADAAEQARDAPNKPATARIRTRNERGMGFREVDVSSSEKPRRNFRSTARIVRGPLNVHPETMRPRSSIWLLLSLLVLFAAPRVAAAAGPDKRPNILFIIFD